MTTTTVDAAREALQEARLSSAFDLMLARLEAAIRAEYAALTRREPLDVERLARCIAIEGYPWEDQSPPGWRNRQEAERIAAEYARLEAADKP